MSTATETANRRGGIIVSPQQAAIVDHVMANAMTVVDAGAGSGKTRTTIATVLEILSRRPDTTPDRFVLITFTNKAADELRARLESALKNLEDAAATPVERNRWVECRERLPGAYVGTIHGYCRDILRNFGYGAFVAREADVEFSAGLLFEAIEDVIEDPAFQSGEFAHVSSTIGRDWHIHDLQSLVRELYGHLRNSALDPNRILDATRRQPPDIGHQFRVGMAQILRSVHDRYERKKKDPDGQRVDAADLLARTADVLDAPQVVRKISARYRWLFVDEFQDTDPTQKRIVDRLAPELEGVLLVGDLKQSIYGWRGAGLRLDKIADEYGTQLLPLNVSRRPTRQLLAVWNALFQSLGNDIDRTGWTNVERYPELDQPLEPSETPIDSTGKMAPLVYVDAGSVDSLELRIEATARKVATLFQREIHRENGCRPIGRGDVAILFRNNKTMDAYERGLVEILPEEITVAKSAGGRFYRRPEVIGVYRLLRLLLDYPSDVSLAQALDTPYLAHIELSHVLQDQLQYGSREGNPLTDRFEDAEEDLARRLRRVRAAARTDTVPELLARLYDALDLPEFHTRHGDARAAHNQERLREVARELTRNEQALTPAAFIRFLREALIRSFDENDAAEEHESDGTNRPHVQLITIHKSKGLEFPIVILPEVQAALGQGGAKRFLLDDNWGLDVHVQGLDIMSPQFWQRRSGQQTDNLHEEMRVLYVAVTRAMNSVVLVGSGPRVVNPPGSTQYAWLDEFRVAWNNRLAPLGAVIDPQADAPGG